MEKKSNKGLICLVIILIVLVLGLGGYIVYDKVLNVEKESNKEQEKQNENKTEDILSEEEKEQLNEKMQIIMEMDDEFDTPHFGYYYEEEQFLTSEMGNQEKIFLALRSLEPERINIPYHEEENAPLIFTEEEVDKALKKIFGSKVVYKHEYSHRRFEGILRKYNSDKKQYEVNNTEVGSRFGVQTEYLITDYKKENNEAKLSVKAAIILSDFNEKGTSSIYNPTHELGSDSKDDLVVANIKWEDSSSLETYADKLDTYIFTFKQEEDNYYFYSVELEK